MKVVEKEGNDLRVRYMNDEIITVASYGSLTSLYPGLETKMTYSEPTGYVNTLTGNKNYIAYGTLNGKVVYQSKLPNMLSHVSKLQNRKHLN